MTTTTTHPGSASTARGLVPAVAATSTLVALGFTALGAHDWSELLVVGAVIVVTAAVVFGLVVPRALRKESAGGTALALAVPAALLVVPAFWSGLPMVLGAAALLVGDHGRRARTGAGTSIAALVLGALAMLAYVAIYVGDATSGGAGFLFD
jgi:hypothetical protein